ncbi:protein-L-isoaspartate(D-aspartate) O-methyltransferase [Kaarinaea lacus]
MTHKSRQLLYRQAVIGWLFFFGSAVASAAPSWDEAMRGMIAAIKDDAEMTSLYIGKDKFDQNVLTAMQNVPRHEFVPNDQQIYAYENRPLPIGYGQTISQPYIVALMTDMLEINSNDKVLEIGTGSGYQAAILNQLSKQVFTIEIVDALAKRAKDTFQRLQLDKITVRAGDGYYGWPEHAPFDAIIVTAAASHIPPPLIAQLKSGGRMIIPVGSRFFVQHLVLINKDEQGKVTTRQILPVRFVPLTGGH